MDSRIATYEHIHLVQIFLWKMILDLQHRQQVHDQSKLVSPEVEVFDEFTPKLATSTYGSDEYKSFLAAMKPALDHHYATNDHHPEFHAIAMAGEGYHPEMLTSGRAVSNMSLLSLVEMICDWKAATMRHKDGDIRKSIEINQKRFGYSDELKQILLNTLPALDLGK